MLGAILGLLAVAAAVFFLGWKTGKASTVGPGGVSRWLGRLGASLLSRKVSAALLLLWASLFVLSSILRVDDDKVGHLKRVYAFYEPPFGRHIAFSGEKGPQAKIFDPGLHFVPLVRALYEIEEFPVINIPSGHYGNVTALDGRPMPPGMFFAPPIDNDQFEKILDAESFLKDGGYRGAQTNVLMPGTYRLNRYLFRVEVDPGRTATIVPAGKLGLVQSLVIDPKARCDDQVSPDRDKSGEASSVPLVPHGCAGIWREPLLPGVYNLNRMAYGVRTIEANMLAGSLAGRGASQRVDVSIDQRGNILLANRRAFRSRKKR